MFLFHGLPLLSSIVISIAYFVGFVNTRLYKNGDILLRKNGNGHMTAPSLIAYSSSSPYAETFRPARLNSVACISV